MKKTCLVCILLIVLFVLTLPFGGCKSQISTELSDHSEEHSLARETEESASPASDPTSSDPTPSDPEESGADPSLPASDAPARSSEQQESPAAASFLYREPSSDTEGYLAACATAGVNVRSGAGTGYRILSTLGQGDSLPYLWREGEWIAVWTGERVGYLHRKYAFVTETNLAIERTIRAGLLKLGTPYLWGATRILNDAGERSPYFTGKNFDCSSFVQYCFYIGSGIKLGSYTGSQADYTVGKKIDDYQDLHRGDFYFTGTDGTISHVVIYLGNHLLLQTYSANGGPVSVTTDDRWKGKFISGRRPDLSVIDQYKKPA